VADDHLKQIDLPAVVVVIVDVVGVGDIDVVGDGDVFEKSST